MDTHTTIQVVIICVLVYLIATVSMLLHPEWIGI
jgi:hypothetical protein